MSKKMTFDLPPNFGDSNTINMIYYRLVLFHNQSLQAFKQKAIAWLHPKDFRKAEMAYANSPASFAYVPPIADIRYLPIGNDKAISSIQCKEGVMEIEVVVNEE